MIVISYKSKRTFLFIFFLFLLKMGASQEFYIKNIVVQDSLENIPRLNTHRFSGEHSQRIKNAIYNDKKIEVPYEAYINTAATTAVLRSAPIVTSSIIDSCQIGTKVKVLEKTNQIYRKVTINDTIGYISIVFLTRKEE